MNKIFYTALLIDLKSSKNYRSLDRSDIQYFLKDCIEELNKIFAPSLQFSVVFSAGDEIQGLFKSPVAAFLYFRLLNMFLAPVEIRAGIGVGDWSIKVESGFSTEQDGAAYHYAREAIRAVYTRPEYNIFLNSKNKFDIYINEYLNLSGLLTRKQSEYQNQLMLITELLYPLYSREDMDDSKVLIIIDLLYKKMGIQFYSEWQSRNIKGRTPNIVLQNHIYTESFVDIDQNYASEEFPLCLDNITWKKGLSAAIAQSIGTSRQNVEKSLKIGGIISIRDLDLITVRFIKDSLGME